MAKKPVGVKKVKAVEAEVVTSEISTEVQSIAITPMSLIERAMAVDGDVDLDKMEKLFELNLRYEENEAKKAFHKAVAAFKAESIDIIKGKKVSFTTSKGTTEYNHAELGAVMLIVTPFMSKHGLSHHWEYDQPEGKVKVTCIMTHEMGYSKETSLTSAKDDSGGKNGIQAIGSATSYLERYTYLALCGLASREQDDDGRSAEPDPEIEYITDSQAMDLHALISEVEADEAKFLEYMTIVTKTAILEVGQIQAVNFKLACKSLEAKR